MSSNISYNLSGKYGIGKTVSLSKEDFDRLNGKSLCCLSSGYIMIWDKKAKYFHRWLMNLETDDKQVVDHIKDQLIPLPPDVTQIESKNSLNSIVGVIPQSKSVNSSLSMDII